METVHESEHELDEDDDFDVNYIYGQPRLLPSEVKYNEAIVRFENQRDYRFFENDATEGHTNVPGTSTQDSKEIDQEESETSEDEEEITNIFIDVRDEGSKYTDLTTFHGMRRIFVAQTWPSRLFWCVVVTTCLTFYMIFSGRTLSAYHNKTTFLMKRIQKNAFAYNEMRIHICKRNKSLSCNGVSYNGKFGCSHRDGCLMFQNFQFSRKRDLRFLHEKIKITSEHGAESILSTYSLSIYIGPVLMYSGITSNARTNTLQLSLRKRILLDVEQGGNCCELWSRVEFLPQNIIVKAPYSLKNCEILRRSIWMLKTFQCVMSESVHLFEKAPNICEFRKTHYTKGEVSQIQELKCRPQCRKNYLKTKLSQSKGNRKSAYRIFSLQLDTWIKEEVQTRKMGLIDVLSLLGGATSMFLGCSSVTVMEMFIFLLKSVTQLLLKQMDDEGTVFGMKIPKRILNSASIVTGRRRAFQLPENRRQIAKRRSISAPNILVRRPSRRPSLWSIPYGSSRRRSMKQDDKSLKDPITIDNQWDCRRLDEAGPSQDWSNTSSETRRPPSLKQLRDNVTFTKASSHSIEKFVRNLPIQDRLSFDLSDEGKYLIRQNAVDIPDEQLKKYFAQNGLDFPENEPKPARKGPSKRSVTVSDTSSTRSSFSIRSRCSNRDEITIISMNPTDSNRRRPSVAYTRKMPMNDF